MLSTFTNWMGQILKIKVNSVTDSPFRFGLLALFFAFAESFFAKTIPAWTIIVTFSFSGMFFIMGWIAYFIVLHKNPNLLRSEEYQLKRETFGLIGDKDNPHPADPAKAIPTTNKQIESLSSKEIN